MKNETLQATLEATELRLDQFLAKLDERVNQLLEGFAAEAPALIANDELYNQGYHRFLSAMRGQLTTIRQKVGEVRDNQVLALFYQHNQAYSIGSGSTFLYNWYSRCQEKITGWEDSLYRREQEAIACAEAKDYEPVFQQLLERYYAAADKVFCRQCSSKLAISQVYYYSTYVSCDFCHTQNIFDPGTDARQLEDIARKLAEQRSKHLLNDPKAYYRAVFDELNILLPDLHEHHERFFQSMQAGYLSHKSSG